MHKFRRIIFFLLLISFLSGCSAFRKKKDPIDISHTVRHSGETLGYISKWYTGNFDNWKAIKTYNGIEKANSISLGQEIKIPFTLVVRQEQPPRAFFQSPARNTSVQTKTTDSNQTVVKENIDQDQKPELIENEAAGDAVVEPNVIEVLDDPASKSDEEAKEQEEKSRDELLDELLGDIN